MDDPQKPNITFRQAIAGKWQIPLFIFSLVVFVTVLLQMRPHKVKLTFEQKYTQLKQLATDGRYHDFYAAAEQLRQQAQNKKQLGMVHLLAAQTRVKQLMHRQEWGLNYRTSQGPAANYQYIIRDYRQAMWCGYPDPNSPQAVPVYNDISLAYWGLNDSAKAIATLRKALRMEKKYDPYMQRCLIKMYLASRPDGYLDICNKLLDKMLVSPASGKDDKMWAFVRKAEVLIASEQGKKALAWLNKANDAIKNSKYGNELQLLRGRALHRAGQADKAEQILRALVAQIKTRGDVYAQAVLELGKINYEQYRDKYASYYYKQLVDTQSGSDWYAAGLLGLAECAAMQQRYNDAATLYQQVVSLLKKNPHNRAVNMAQVRDSLRSWSQQLTMLKQYNKALLFLEIERKVAPADDIDAAYRYARAHSDIANQILTQINQSKRAGVVSGKSLSPEGKKWLNQQQQLVKEHFEQAADQYLRVANLAVDKDKLYGDCLYDAASCYDKAGDEIKSIETWHRFVLEREGQPRWPEGVFFLAQAYQSQGQYDRAISYYNILLEKHPNLPVTFSGIVPLARCYLAQDPPQSQKAEKLLKSVLDNQAIDPQAIYYRQAMFELGQLYYDNKKYPAAITILTEAIDRYPEDPQLGKSMYLVGDSYRKSVLELTNMISANGSAGGSTNGSANGSIANPTKKSTNIAIVTQDRIDLLKQQRLEKARKYFTQAIEFYGKKPEVQLSKLDKLYQRLCWLYRADCLFDMKQYSKALAMYEETALRYQLTPTALMALVQEVNCQLALGNNLQARAANQRAMWQLRKTPDAVLAEGGVGLSRQQWQQWFNWTNKSGLW